MYRVELSKRAMRDLRRIDHGPRKRLLALLERELAAEPQPPNLDVKANGSSTGATSRRPQRRCRRSAAKPKTEP